MIWGLEFSVDPGAFGPARHVLRLDVCDQPANKRLYWFVCQGGSLDLCISDPGGGTDVYLAATLRDMIHLYRGDVSLPAAMEAGRLTVDGPPRLIRRLSAWFNLGPMAATAPAGDGGAGRPMARRSGR